MKFLRRVSLRARLTLACTAVAAIVGVAALALFTFLLDRGVSASVDTVLQGRASQAVGELAAGSPRGPAAPPAARQVHDDIDSLTVVYTPAGRLWSSSPVGSGASLLDRQDLAAARTGALHATVTSDRREAMRVLAVPVSRTGGTWVVAVATSMGPATAAADRAVTDLRIGLPVLLALVAAGAWLLAGAALRPVERMRVDAETLGRADPGGPAVLRIPPSAELARLGRTFNDLLARLQRSLARQQELVADTGHELRTPLTVLRTELELADSPGRTREELADSVAHARREVERLSKLAEDVLFLARADSAVPLVQVEPVELTAVLAEAERAHRAQAEYLGVHLETSAPAPVWVSGDAQALRRVADNLVANSLASVAEGGRVTMAAAVRGGRGILEVSDDGPGFPPGFAERAFERFSRPESSRPSGRGGAGLGLAIVAEIARALGGTARAGNGGGGGAVVTLEIPLSGTATGTSGPAAGASEAAPGYPGAAPACPVVPQVPLRGRPAPPAGPAGHGGTG